MAPPKYTDLSKKFNDLLKDDFGFGQAKLTLKSKTASGVNLKVETIRAFDSGVVSGLLEVKYTNSAHGLTVKDTWNTKNNITTEVSVENNPLKGHKFTFTNNSVGTGFTKNWKLKHDFTHDAFVSETSVDSGSVSTNGVFHHGKFNVGASAAFDLGGKLKSHSVAASFTENDTIFNASIANVQDVTASIYHVPQANTQVGVELTWKTNSGDNTFTIVGKHDLDKDSFVKASLDKKLLVGFGYTQKLNSAVSLTLAAQIDGNNLSADSHRLGASLTFEN